MIIDCWGLPPGFPADQVPAPVASFAKATLGAELDAAIEMANEWGLQPEIEPLAAVADADTGVRLDHVYRFHLSCDDGEIPFMIRLKSGEPVQ